MKIGIDARFYGKAGPGRYTKSIIQHLEKIDTDNEYIIFMMSDTIGSYTPKNPNFRKVLANYKWYSFAEQFGFLFKLLQYKLDLYYVPHFNIPILYPKKIITAIPDMTMHTYSSEAGTTLPMWYFKVKKFVYKFVFWWAVKRSIKVIVPSKAVMRDFTSYFKYDEEKYVLAYEGVDPDFAKRVSHPERVLEKFGIDRNYILCVGSMYEHKNTEGLIEMFKILKSRHGYKGQFVLASKRDKFSKRIFDKVESEGLSDDIKVLSYLVSEGPTEMVISDEEVIALRMKSQLYVQASFKEGFSLTALEGMAIGLPAALSDIDTHREVYDDSVLYFDPHNPEDIAEKVRMMLEISPLKREFIKKGYKQVEKYDWKNTAETTLEVFNQALKN